MVNGSVRPKSHGRVRVVASIWAEVRVRISFG
jgi:hypothetical protein